jgi:hypothetical protein
VGGGTTLQVIFYEFFDEEKCAKQLSVQSLSSRGGVQWQVKPPVMAVMIISDSWVIKAAVNCWLPIVHKDPKLGSASGHHPSDKSYWFGVYVYII